MSVDRDEKMKVEDRRHFDRDGNVVRPEGEPTDKKDPSAPGAGSSSSRGPSEVKIDFISVLFSYVQTAMIYLGEVEDPIQNQTTENLEGAHQMIEILELMEQKTRGNRTEQESQFLESALYDLRMRYMKKSKLIK